MAVPKLTPTWMRSFCTSVDSLLCFMYLITLLTINIIVGVGLFFRGGVEQGVVMGGERGPC